MKFSDIQLSNTSGHERTFCPVCSPDRKKSREKCLSVDIDEKIWFCHHCGESGGHKEAKTYFKPVFKKPESKLPNNVIEYFKKIGIPEKVLANNNIGYGKSFSDANGIQYPYYKDGEVVNIKHRTSDKRFRQEKDAEKCFYRFDSLKNGTGTLIITEGENDALAFNACGFDNVVSIPDGAPPINAKSYTTKFDFLRSAEKYLEQYDKIVLCTDNDEPGKVAQKELARRIGYEKCFTVKYNPGCKDACDVLKTHGLDDTIKIVDESEPWPISGVFTPNDFTSQLEDEYRYGVKGGTSTGWYSLDNFYTVRGGEMTIVTGIPSHGKSNFLDAMMLKIAESKGWRFGLFSPENLPCSRHLRTLIEKYTGRPFAGDKAGIQRLKIDEIKIAQRMLNKVFRFIAPNDELLTVENILIKAKQLVKQFGIKGLVIDPWNEIEHKYGNLREDLYISKQLSMIRRFARENDVHVWVVAHPAKLKKNGSGGYDPPTAYDIAGGAQFRNKADNILCVYRGDFNNNETTVFSQKIRFREIGKIGEAVLHYNQVSSSYD